MQLPFLGNKKRNTGAAWYDVPGLSKSQKEWLLKNEEAHQKYHKRMMLLSALAWVILGGWAMYQLWWQ